MVRKLVFVQVAVSQGRLPVETLVEALEPTSTSSPGNQNRKLRGDGNNRIPANLAPACGLTLVEVFYDNLV
jgi:tRNA U38,U39,U40 pseudouridine synthase TruA